MILNALPNVFLEPVLDWYLVDWTQTTNTIDYGIKSIDDNGKVTLERIGRMPMPLDILVVLRRWYGGKFLYSQPVNAMGKRKSVSTSKTNRFKRLGLGVSNV